MTQVHGIHTLKLALTPGRRAWRPDGRRAVRRRCSLSCSTHGRRRRTKPVPPVAGQVTGQTAYSPIPPMARVQPLGAGPDMIRVPKVAATPAAHDSDGSKAYDTNATHAGSARQAVPPTHGIACVGKQNRRTGLLSDQSPSPERSRPPAARDLARADAALLLTVERCRITLLSMIERSWP
jgi:hypothetical protein